MDTIATTTLERLQRESEFAAAACEKYAGPSGNHASDYWRGRADGIAYAISELEAVSPTFDPNELSTEDYLRNAG